MKAGHTGPTTMANTPNDDCDEDLAERPEEIARRYVEEHGSAKKEEHE